MNNDKHTAEYLEKLKGMKLSEASRERMQAELLEYARFHGVRVAADSRSIEQVSPPTVRHTTLFTLFKTRKSMTAALIAIMMLAGGGTSFAAEGAVPGDFLYPVKIEINENVKSVLAVSNEAEAALQARLAEERLAEAETLAARGELTAEASTKLSTQLKKHYEEAEARSDTAEAEGNYETSATVRASLEGTLRTYATVLTDLNARVAGNDGTTLITNIRTYADATATAQATATVDVSADVQADVAATVAAASDRVAMVQTKAARVQNKLSAEARAEVEAKLDMAIAAEAKAQASLQTEAYQEAYTSAQAALRLAQETSSMIDSRLRLQVEVKAQADTVIDSILEVTTDTAAESDKATTSDTTETTATDSGSTDTDAAVDVGLEIDTDVDINADGIDAGVESNTSLKSGLSL